MTLDIDQEAPAGRLFFCRHVNDRAGNTVTVAETLVLERSDGHPISKMNANQDLR